MSSKRPTRAPGLQRKTTISSVHFGTIRNMNRSQEDSADSEDQKPLDYDYKHFIDPLVPLNDVLLGSPVTIDEAIASVIEKNKELEEYVGSTKLSAIAKVAEIFKICKFTDHDVWEGEPQIFPIINHFSNELKSTIRFNETPIQVHLPKLPEFEGIEFKVYQVDKSWKINKVVRIICKKFKVMDSSKFILASMRDFYFDSELSLSDYGLGSLFRSWQLKISTVEEKQLKDQLQKETKIKKASSSKDKNSPTTQSEREKRSNERKIKLLERKEKLSKKKATDEKEDAKKLKSKEDSDIPKVMKSSRGDTELKKNSDSKLKKSSSDDDSLPSKTDSQKKIKTKDSSKTPTTSSRRRSQSVTKMSDQLSKEDDDKEEKKKKKSKSKSKSKSTDQQSSKKEELKRSSKSSSKSSSSKSRKKSSQANLLQESTSTQDLAGDDTKESINAASTKKTLPILFILENYTMFDDLKVQRLNFLPNMTIKKVISSVLERHGLYSKLNEFILANTRGKVLHPLSTLESYGVGIFLNQWELILIQRTAEEVTELELSPFSHRFSWIKSKDVQPGLQLSEAKKIILSLDSRIRTFENEDLTAIINEKDLTITSLKRDVKILKETEEKLKKQLKLTESERAELPTLSEEIKDLKKFIDELEEELEEKKKTNTTLQNAIDNEKSLRNSTIEKIHSSHKAEVMKLSEYSSIMFEKNEELIGELEELRGEFFELRQKMKASERERDEARIEAIEKENDYEVLLKEFEEYKYQSIKQQEDTNRQLRNAQDHVESLRNSLQGYTPEQRTHTLGPSSVLNTDEKVDEITVSPTCLAPPPPPPPPPSISMPQSFEFKVSHVEKSSKDGVSILNEIEATRQVLKRTEQNTENKASERNCFLKEIHLFSKKDLNKVVAPVEKPKIMDDLTAALNKRFIAMTDLMDTIEDLSDSDSDDDSWDKSDDNTSIMEESDDNTSVLGESDDEESYDSDSSSSDSD